jgi:hypothetical protein
MPERRRQIEVRFERGNAAAQQANDILALTKLRPSSAWINSDELDHLVSSLRRTAGERRIGANVRLQALRRRSFIELGTPDLDTDPCG